jgi:hypothetical protein
VPAGLDGELPIGVSFIGTRFADGGLLSLAFSSIRIVCRRAVNPKCEETARVLGTTLRHEDFGLRDMFCNSVLPWQVYVGARCSVRVRG